MDECVTLEQVITFQMLWLDIATEETASLAQRYDRLLWQFIRREVEVG